MTSFQHMPYGALEQYLQTVKWVSQFADGEEDQLLSCLRTGGNVQAARTRLVEGYQSLVIGLAKRYARWCQSMEFMDLVQEGNVGLLQALDRYGYRDGSASFRTWAFTWVRGAMLAALSQYEGAFHIPSEKIRNIRRMERVSVQLLSLLGREPTITEIAQEMQVEEGVVRELMMLQGQEVYSLYLPVDEDGETLLADVVEDSVNEFSGGEASLVEDALAQLTEQERLVLKLRYGFEDGQAYTQREVAELLGVDLSKVVMVDRTAKKRLRKALEAVA